MKIKQLLTLGYYEWKYYQILKIFFPKHYQQKKKNFNFQVRERYLYQTGKSLFYRFPSDLNEKLHWLSRYWKNPLIVKCSDKYRVREYVTECGLEEILIPLIGVYDNVNEIDFDSLPSKFVLKCNHGSGYNIICDDKEKFDKQTATKQLNAWILEDYVNVNLESHYSKIDRKIICEKYLDFSEAKSLIDYKVFCINGVPLFFELCAERDTYNRTIEVSTYSLEWEKISLLINESKTKFCKPQLINDMIKYAEILSKPFPFVRVDFYYTYNKIFFGELTFTPCGNICYRFKNSSLKMIGNKLKLPQKLKSI